MSLTTNQGQQSGSGGNDNQSSTLQEMAGVIVTAIGLAALVAIVIVAFYQLPSSNKSQNVVALATSAFGVIGAVVGAFFGVRAANRAADKVSKANDNLASKLKNEN